MAAITFHFVRRVMADFKGGEGRVVGQYLLAVGHAEGEEINNRLVWFEPNGNARGVAHLGATFSDQEL